MPIARAWEIVVETEAEWSDDDRFRLLALGRYDAGVCACGFHEDIASDEENNFFTPTQRVCPVCKGIALQSRVVSASDIAEAKHLDDKPDRPRQSDGRHLGMRMLTAAEAAAEKRKSDR